MQQKILIIEDEPAIQAILKELLTDAGYVVQTANDGLMGLQAFHKEPFDLILLDIMMPKLDGYMVCEKIRETSHVPIVILTALDDEQAQVKAFELQADDYITKPFSLKIVLLRIEAVLRREGKLPQDAQDAVYTYKNLLVDTAGMQVLVDGIEVTLTPTEYRILVLLLQNQGRVFSRDNLINLVWGYDFYGDEKTVNIHIMNLRRKLGAPYIETIRGVGYRLAKES